MSEGNSSQKLSRDSGESIFAARHQGVSQGPLGSLWREFKGQMIFSEKQGLEGQGRNFPRRYRAISAGPTFLAPTPLRTLPPRPNWDLKSAFSGPNQVEIRSELGLGGGVRRGSGPEG